MAVSQPSRYRLQVRTPSGMLLYGVDGASGARSFYHYDEAGNTAFLTNDVGGVTTEYSYGPFGGVSALGQTTDNLYTYGAGRGMMALTTNGITTGLWHVGGGVYDERTMRMVSALATQSGPGSVHVGDPNIIGDPNVIGDPNLAVSRNPGPSGDPGSMVSLNPQPFPPGAMVALNPQPFPPGQDVGRGPGPIGGDPGSEVALNPQPFPPTPGEWVGLNPQPFPPGPSGPNSVMSIVYQRPGSNSNHGMSIVYQRPGSESNQGMSIVYQRCVPEYREQDDSDGLPNSWEQVGGADFDCDGVNEGSPWFFFEHSDGGHHLDNESSTCAWCPQ
jgi:hypothetical protein